MTEDEDFKAIHEIGKIFNSFLDKALLCDFFLESSLGFVNASEGYLFLAGREDKLWLETFVGSRNENSPAFQEKAEQVFLQGKITAQPGRVFVPLVVRNTAIGVACFCKSGCFSEKEAALAANLASQAAAALKNILLFEQNLKMERLAAIGQTMSMVLHEVKNIIQLARFSHEYLKMGLAKQNKDYLDKGLNGIDKAVREMEDFTYETLSLTKDYKISPEPVPIPELLRELRESLHGRATQYKIELDFKCDTSLGQVEGEARSLYRTLLNLVKNAIEASDSANPKPYVRIRVSPKDENSYEIVVEDNGKGMKDETKAKLFQAFFSTKGAKGTGLGLLIIDRTIKAHQGQIRVESEEGKGTRFILTLPKTLPR